MPDVYFTSDTHYGHSKIIEYCTRPFADANEMDEMMIHNWNAVVRPDDLIYHIGDFALCDEKKATRIAKRLLGQKHLVFGNHDKRLRKHTPFLDEWVWTKDIAEVSVDGQLIVLLHYAMRVWNQSHRGSWHLYGHSHGSLPGDPSAKSLDVGVDNWNYTPVSLKLIAAEMAKREWKPVDHHGPRFQGEF